jgi:hypothetical protein
LSSTVNLFKRQPLPVKAPVCQTKAMPSMAKDKRTLIVHQGALGDFVVLWPVLRALHRRFGPLDLLAPFSFGRLAKDRGLVADHMPIEAEWVAALYGDGVHPLAVQLLKNHAQALVFSKNRVLTHSLKRIIPGPVMRIDPRPAADRRIHVRTFILAQLAAAGILVDAPSHPMPAPTPALEGTVFIHPGAGSHRKQWPLERFTDLAGQLAAERFTPAFVVGPADKSLANDLQALTGKRFAVHQPTDVQALARLLSSGAAYIGNDAGPTHLAAALGLATMAIFGPSDPLRWQPEGLAVSVVRPAVPCRPCFETALNNCENPLCLLETSVTRVMTVFHQTQRALKRS